jgi:hypothetical protein
MDSCTANNRDLIQRATGITNRNLPCTRFVGPWETVSHHKGKDVCGVILGPGVCTQKVAQQERQFDLNINSADGHVQITVSYRMKRDVAKYCVAVGVLGISVETGPCWTTTALSPITYKANSCEVNSEANGQYGHEACHKGWDSA